MVKQTDNLSTKVLFKTLLFLSYNNERKHKLKNFPNSTSKHKLNINYKNKNNEKKFINFISAVYCSINNSLMENQMNRLISEQTENRNENNDKTDTPISGKNGRYLVLYSSRTNNTEHVAQTIQSILDCDILEVEPQIPYDDDYNSMLNRAQKELEEIRQGNYPAIKTSVDNFDNYDIIFIGYPIWYGSMATPMQSFLYQHASKLSGKQIALFATSGSSGITSSVNEAQSICTESILIEQSLLLTSSTLPQMESRITEWLDRIGADREESDIPESSSPIINIKIGDRTITATMEDNAAARDFLSRLPLEVTLNDYNNITEKIFYPSPALTTEGVTRGCTPISGDITIYVPWGNVAIFCKIGHIVMI